MSDRLDWMVTAACAAILLLAVVMLWSARSDCDKAGGVLVKDAWGGISCVQKSGAP